MATLSIDNKTEDVPAVIRGTWRHARATYVLVMVPGRQLVCLARFQRGADTASLVTTKDGRMPRYSEMKPMDAGKALTVVRNLSERDVSSPLSKSTARLRGRWSGRVLHGSSGHPVVNMVRRVGQATAQIRVPDIAEPGFTASVSLAASWKGGPRQSKIRATDQDGKRLGLSGAFMVVRRQARTILQTLHGESDRRQHHDAAYAKKRPTKWSRTPHNPVDRVTLSSRLSKKATRPKKTTRSTPAKATAAKTRNDPFKGLVTFVEDPGFSKNVAAIVLPSGEHRHEFRAVLWTGTIVPGADVPMPVPTLEYTSKADPDRSGDSLSLVAARARFNEVLQRLVAEGQTVKVLVPRRENREAMAFFREETVQTYLGTDASQTSGKASKRAKATPTAPSSKTSSPSERASQAKHRAAAKRAKRRAARSTETKSSAGKSRALTQQQKDEQLLLMVSKAIKDALRPGGVR